MYFKFTFFKYFILTTKLYKEYVTDSQQQTHQLQTKQLFVSSATYFLALIIIISS
jgi:hypothetical protein